MKTIPPPCPEPESGVKYWRSIDQLAETPEFQAWAEKEFPAGASQLEDGATRRDFIKLMSASFALAGAGMMGSGCRRPVENIYPFSRLPEGYTHGVAQFFATAMPSRGSAIPLVVKSHEGRPTKVEGNSLHPGSNGATDNFAQASVLGLYDADRAQRFTEKGNTVSRDKAVDALGSIAKKFAATQGDGLCFLLDQNNSPSLRRVRSLVSQKYPKARWFTHEPVDLSFTFTFDSIAPRTPVAQRFKLAAANVILSLDCDFIGTEEDRTNHIRGFAKGRKVAHKGDKMNRLYAVEALMTQTGMNADHRLRLASGSVISIAAHVAAAVSPDLQSLAAKFPLPAGVKPEWIKECAADLAANRGASLVLAGYRQPMEVHLLVFAINQALGNFGKTVTFHAVPAPDAGLPGLAKLLDGGSVDTLVILGGNPAYSAPADLKWAATQRKARTVVRLGAYEDETSVGCDLHLPAAHYLESWGDARTSDGTLVPVQPLIAPLYGGLTEIEVLARIGGLDTVNPHEIARETFKGITGPLNFEENWKKFLHDGFAGSASPVVPMSLPSGAVSSLLASASAPAAPTKDKLEVIFTRDSHVDDGRYSNNGWLQEFPDPVTKLTWDNAVLMSRKTAVALGVDNEDVVEISVNGGKVSGPVWIQPGQADFTLGLALGYGREKSGRIGNFSGGQVGFNAYKLRASTTGDIVGGATAKPTGEKHKLAQTQDHWSMEGRPIIREGTKAEFDKDQKFVKRFDMPAPPSSQPMYPNPFDELTKKPNVVHQWGMVIDLSACVGCSACVTACQSENNVPIVGKQQVGKGREMHWLRIDRYYSASPEKQRGSDHALAKDSLRPNNQQQIEEWIDDPQVVNQPMLCQHCEAAPCESVCPVNATAHDEEGLNVMVYNRCVGTRYCSNNCPYKVRRFNFFDYNRRPLDELYKSPLFSAPNGEWGALSWLKNPDKGTKHEEDWEIVKLARNPEVSVRMRGVMEKCTFCVQRIEGAKIDQKVKAGASGDVAVPDGTFKVACQQACPAEAITFGNLNDPKSEVSIAKLNPRNYSVLEFLATKPRTTYLARVRNPNSKMPDSYATPLTSQEWESSLGGHHAEAGHGAAADAPSHGATEKKGAKH